MTSYGRNRKLNDHDEKFLQKLVVVSCALLVNFYLQIGEL
jgi:hypothetical protein